MILNSVSGIAGEDQDNRELCEVWKELSRTMRDHGVVSVQTKNKSKTDSEDNKE
jgi:hypothetical protein